MRIIAARALRHWGAAVVAVCASLLLSPNSSEAGCGDYVRVHGGIAPMGHSMAERPASTESDDAADYGLPHCPCQGPNCSNGSVPPESPGPGVVVSIDRWALAPGDKLLNFVCCGNMLAEPFDLMADGFRLSLLRPPR